jgi:hypothetical protein
MAGYQFVSAHQPRLVILLRTLISFLYKMPQTLAANNSQGETYARKNPD